MTRIYDNFYSRLVDWVGRHSYFKRHERSAIIAFLKKIKPKKILDFGCNSGLATSEFRKHTGAAVFGTDINKYALDYGRKKYPDVNFISLKKAAGMKGFFDVIIVSNVLEHVPDCDETLSFLKGLLAPKGKLIISVPQERIRGDCNIPHIFLCSLQNKKYTNPHLRVLKLKELNVLLEKEGMRIRDKMYVNMLPPFFTKRYVWPSALSLVVVCR
ncbi:class I SAM-dependent methyltransferase [Candidatus Woesearchaeota archaeon]|nr:class I SAM-dependent methyltransferase [Candidatus Woesearchaeota archaeon]MBW3016089.1 class I SAM-dependent methyltransferase [Candidatus Woesearchaeota archaeon]